MFSRIDALATSSVVLLIIGFLGSTYFLSIDHKTGNIGGLNSASVRSLGRVNAVSWQNWREYVFIYDCLKDAGSPDPNCLDGMRILEVMTLMTYRGRVYAVIAPVGEIWSFDGENWTVAFVWDSEPHPQYRWRGGAWSGLIFNDKLYFFGYTMHSDGSTWGCGIRFDGDEWSFKECLHISEFYSSEVYQTKIYCAGVSGIDTYVFSVDPDSLEFSLIHIEKGVGTPAFMSANRWSGELYIATGCWEHGERMIFADEVYANLLVFDGVDWRKYGLYSEEGFESVTVNGELGVIVGASSGSLYRFSDGMFIREYDLGGIHPIKLFSSGGNVGKDWWFDYLWVCGGSRSYYRPIGGKMMVFNNGEWCKLLESAAIGFSDVEMFGSWVLVGTVWPRDHTRVSVLIFPVGYFADT